VSRPRGHSVRVFFRAMDDPAIGHRSGGVKAAGCGSRSWCAALAVRLWLLLVLLPTLASVPAFAAERRVALVVGNGAYAQSPLPNTINDARAMTEVLGRLGFKVITRLNSTQREMLLAIVEFGQELEKGGVGLFYYAGHAVQIRGKNFMIPINAKISVEDHVEPESVDLNKVIGRMAGARNKLNIVILDSCRDNPFGDTFNFYSEGLAQTRAPAGSYIAYAAAPGELAADGTGANSFYTGALIRTPCGVSGFEALFVHGTLNVVRPSKLSWTNIVPKACSTLPDPLLIASTASSASANATLLSAADVGFSRTRESGRFIDSATGSEDEFIAASDGAMLSHNKSPADNIRRDSKNSMCRNANVSRAGLVPGLRRLPAQNLPREAIARIRCDQS